MNIETAEQLAKTAAIEAVKEYNKNQKKIKRARVFQNAKKLMENYNRICESVEKGVAELSDMDNADELEEFTAEDIFIHSILKSKLRSIVMIAHVDKCLALLEEEQQQRGTPEKYLAFKAFYIEEISQEDIAKDFSCTDRTIRRWITELTGILSIYLFGADAIKLE